MRKIGLFTLLLIFVIKMNGQNENSELKELKSKMIEQAIGVAKEFNVILDFSDNSIKNVESILSELNVEYERTKNDEGLNGLAYMFGFYIVDVIERNHGKGRLERHHPEFGENSFPFYWNDGTLFPMGWCQKRIFDGKEDDIEFKYRVFVLEDND